jgi:hypothetical protein
MKYPGAYGRAAETKAQDGFVAKEKRAVYAVK